MKKQWGKFMSDLLLEVDRLRRASSELDMTIKTLSYDQYDTINQLVRVKTIIDECIWTQEQEINLYNRYIEESNDQH